MGNGWFAKYIAVVAALALGAWGFTYMQGRDIRYETKAQISDHALMIDGRLTRIERKLDCLINRGTECYRDWRPE